MNVRLGVSGFARVEDARETECFSVLVETLIAVAGTLLGVVVGVVGSYFTQRTGHQRESQERLATVRRQIYVEFLTAVHDMYLPITAIHKAHRDGSMTTTDAIRGLQAVPAREAQAALENLRLVASDTVAAAGALLWERLRRDGRPLGNDLDPNHFKQWRRLYWNDRRGLIDAARRDIGFPALDWSSAGVGPGKMEFPMN
ncbi:MAG: hypothetical protein EOP24_38320 [Hyphomicrobiales bacterium]|nr:MAG: hypothetical protein EOP24_38320 [Hyphomicrobiales bacterium]